MMRSWPTWNALALGVILAIAVSAPVSAQSSISAANLEDRHIKAANDALVEALAQRFDSQRFWEPEKVPSGESTRQGGGYTALAMLALMQSGQSYQDPRWSGSIDHLANLQMQGSYAIATRASLWSRLPEKFNPQLARDVKALLDGFNESTGGWDYVPNPTGKYHDHSIRQFGALALWDAARREVRINPNIWHRIEQAYVNSQLADGGWNYKGEGPATGSMTAAGLATLYITQDLLHANDAIKLGAAPASKHVAALERGLAWMERHFTPKQNPGKDDYFFYYLYGVERVGLASGYKTFGGKDWFREGAAEIITRMLTWDAAAESFTLKSAFAKAGRTDDVAFALMFLSRGRVPVAINKLQFEGVWNNRPRDAANLARWISNAAEGDVNWQIVKLSGSPEQWLDAPILYIASNEAPSWIKDIDVNVRAFSQEVREFLHKRAAGQLPADAAPPQRPASAELEKLKRYIDLGGLIVAVNEGGPRHFAEAMEKAGTLMCPQYEWRQLPDDHWAYRAHSPVKGRRPVLRGLSNGVRELIILSAGGEVTATFQRNDTKQTGEFTTFANMYFHSSEMNRARPRLATHSKQYAARNSAPAVQIVRALHAGNWKPEPLALEQFAAYAAESRNLNIIISDHPLAAIHQVKPMPDLVIVNGIEAHEFSEAQFNAIRNYLQGGGVVLFETPGGRGDFSVSAERVMQDAFAKTPEPVLRTRIITGDGLSNAPNLSQIEYRPFTLQAFGTRETAPRLRGITIDEKRGPQLLFSAEDITHALLDQPCWNISGYSSKSARELLANIVQHAVTK